MVLVSWETPTICQYGGYVIFDWVKHIEENLSSFHAVIPPRFNSRILWVVDHKCHMSQTSDNRTEIVQKVEYESSTILKCACVFP